MRELLYPVGAIAVGALVTWALRAFPFLLFGARPLPRVVRYLEKALPPAIMTVLVIYCLRGVSLGSSPYGLPEIAACALVAALHLWKNNMYLSILGGTVLYMLLIRIL